MNSHPVRKVGQLPEFQPDVYADSFLDCHMDDGLACAGNHKDALSNDPLSGVVTTSLTSSETASGEENLTECAHQQDDNYLGNIIASCFESNNDGFDEEAGMTSIDEIVRSSVWQHQTESDTGLEEQKFCAVEGFNIWDRHVSRNKPGMLSCAARTPANFDVESCKTILSYDQTTDKQKGAIKKGKRGRAPARPWTEDEHQRFEESLELFGRNWEQCAAYIGTRRAQLVRSHAQKHLIKLWKLGKPLPKKVAESGTGYTLSGKPLLADSASARSYLTKIPCPKVGDSS